MDANNVLGEFLRARREQVRPEDVGLSGGGLRRVPGLRREEVATLAGISSDYYLRLEQGRDRNPSVQVLEALARVLRLDTDATRHLIGLVGTGRRPVRRRRAARPAPVPVSIQQLIDGWTTNPAYVQNRYADVVAVNALYSALAPHHVPGVNLLRTVFLDPGERQRHRDWEDLTAGVAASLRARAGADIDDPRLVELVGELSLRSERFRLLWGRHSVFPMRARVSRMTHPQVGDIDLYCDKLGVGGSDGLTLVVFHAEPGSRNAELLALLGSLNAPQSTGHMNTGEQDTDTPVVDEQSVDGQ
ncbi:helix-turn-helix transcriptional regulator [Streptomyces sp. NBC_01451]|uniref:helix-turn-helix transcriptional regulator n=1 Tax=Streptomyces sp. NBC_01451 TaxID=2903872 RepID=UPI002E3228BE|nr:helix-turn-helix transcriptional regulator [Streptomyces sp. NBC_01451]